MMPDITLIVDEQLEAYKTRNLDRFLHTLSNDIVLYDFPDTVLATGKKSIRTLYGQIFADLPNMQLTHISRVVIGNRIIDHQELLNWYDSATVSMIVIYEITHNKIHKAWLLRHFH